MDTYCAKLMEFEKFLIDNRMAQKDKAKYYVNWADKYLHGINYRHEAIDHGSIVSFVNSMKNDKRYADWQIRQADSAVRMYVINFLKLSIRPQVTQKVGGEVKPASLSWQEAVLKYKECLRLKHYAYSTEKTYLECMGKFAEYIRKENVLEITDEDVRNYMAHMAVSLHVSASTQNQSFCAILFLYRNVLLREMGDMKDNVRDGAGAMLGKS